MFSTTIFLVVAATAVSCLTTTFVSCRLIVKPSNTVIVVTSGHSTTVRCSTNFTNSSVCWFHTPVGSSDYDILFINNKLVQSVAHRYDIQRSKSDIGASFDLVVKSAELEDAGRYSCRDDNGRGKDAGTGELVVVRGDSSGCQSDAVSESTSTTSWTEQLVEGDSIRMRCAIVYLGRVINSASWNFQLIDSLERSLSHEVSEIMNSTHVHQRAPTNDSSDVVETYFNVTVVQRDCCYRCLVRNGDWSSSFNCSRPTSARIAFPVRDVVIESVTTDSEIRRKSANVSIGDKLLCRADGYPLPTYEWSDVGTGRSISSGPELTLDESHDGRVLHCTASNIIRNVTHSQSSRSLLQMTLAMTSDDGVKSDITGGRYQLFPLSALTSGIVAASALFVAVVIVFGVRACRRNSRQVVAMPTTDAPAGVDGMTVVDEATWWLRDSRLSSIPDSEYVIDAHQSSGLPETTYSVVDELNSTPLYEPLRRERTIQWLAWR